MFGQWLNACKSLCSKTHLIVQLTKLIFVSIDEITIMHYQRWIIIHVYVVEGWKCIPILLTLKQVLLNAIANNLIKVIMKSLLQYGSLSDIDLASKLINFGVNGVLVFQGAKTMLSHN
jgi:hypothetical protein